MQTFLALFSVLERGALPIQDEAATVTSHCAACAVAVELSVNKPISLAPWSVLSSKLLDKLSVLSHTISSKSGRETETFFGN